MYSTNIFFTFHLPLHCFTCTSVKVNTQQFQSNTSTAFQEIPQQFWCGQVDFYAAVFEFAALTAPSSMLDKSSILEPLTFDKRMPVVNSHVHVYSTLVKMTFFVPSSENSGLKQSDSVPSDRKKKVIHREGDWRQLTYTWTASKKSEDASVGSIFHQQTTWQDPS